ncbi:holo-ACP synthase [uncultured Schumannella sp.]|uniref:holo-ACP synthase n=1 Tax=uncultured Schumannella sp. TaxID=1195956 RepID=UPI0025DE7282|nr:holo-ACP synthase [uncultured Schumannella sp.]
MIAGIGIDIVDLARFERAVDRTPRLRARLFAESELVHEGRELPLRSLAGRFAAKEALMKALGETDGVAWHDMEVVRDTEGNPSFRVGGAVSQIMERRGITALHLTMSHDAGIAIAQVIAEASA